MDEWETEKATRRAVETELAKVRGELNAARSDGLDRWGVQAERLDKLVRAATSLVTFTVGNLPPEMTPNWPIDALNDVIENLDALPSFGTNDFTLQTELRAFAREVESHENRRAKTRKDAPSSAA